MRKKLYILIAVLILIVALTVPLFFKNATVIHYELESYSYVCVKDDPDFWLYADFNIDEDTAKNILKSPKEYYVITFEGNLRNNHIYNMYDWYITETKPLTENEYWVDASTIEGTFAFEPFSEAFYQTKILIKCSSEDVVEISNSILEEQLLICKGRTALG